MTPGRIKLLDGVIFEIIPMKNAFEKAVDLPAGALVSVTASAAKGMEATVELSEQLAARGYRVIPHLSARLTKSQIELEGHVERLTAAGITRAFVVGGDADDPGEFFDAMALIRGLEKIQHPFTEVGVTGYPEGHPVISDGQLEAALLEKQPHASYIATQMCFDATKIGNWLSARRAAGAHLPVIVGIPGAIETVKLMTIGARIGVGSSLKYLAKNRRSVAKLLRPGTFTPDDLIDDLGQIAEDPATNLVGLHLFTFNQVEGTLEWLQGVER
ncbi:MAG: methylenetetrahydrofolate reductase [Acidimicrobiia bacterium]